MAFFLQSAWLIPIFPLLAFALITLTPIRRDKQLSGWLAIGMMGLAAFFALFLLMGVAMGTRLDASSPVVQADAHAAGEAAHGTPTGEAAHGAGEGEDGHGAGEGASVHGRPFAFPEPNVVQRIAWVPMGSSSFMMGVYIDPLAAAMLVMVTITAGCIHLFSMGYMAANDRQARFFSFIALFTAAMLAMTMAGDLLLFFMAWEVMGLCSYLLIGFLFQRPTAYRAGVKAFITTRIGDVLMLIGMAYLYTHVGSLEFGMGAGQIFNPQTLERLAAETNALGLSHATTIALLIFAGTVGKAAQFPLHVWLPDAMEGPTPVSALIHAATMVSAGVYLVGRVYPIFTADDGTALLVVKFIGTGTALFAASIAVAQFDIKRILAYSTLSQLGFMVAALGTGGWVAGMFHLLTHAFFKALLFLGSGSVIHGMEGTRAIEEIHHHDEYAAQQTAQDIRNMGDLRTYMPWTFWTYTMGYLALAGLPFFAGFWSKDEILDHAWEAGFWVVYVLLTIASFLTAFYMTRQWRMVFFGSYRGDKPLVWQREGDAADHAPAHGNGHAAEGQVEQHEAHGGGHDRPHESDWTMVAPLVVLAVFAVTAGFFNLPFPEPLGHWLSNLWQQAGAIFNPLVGFIAVVLAGLGVWAGWSYDRAFATAQDRDPLEARLPMLFRLLNRAFAIDYLYAQTIGRLTNALAVAWNVLDRYVIDRLVNGTGLFTLFLSRINFIIDDTLLNDGPDAIATGTNVAGDQARRTQTGKVEDYIGLVFAGVVVLGLIYLYGLQ